MKTATKMSQMARTTKMVLRLKREGRMETQRVTRVVSQVLRSTELSAKIMT